jgi:hypothetical protein
MYTMYLVEESLANFCFDISLLVCASNHLCYLARWFFIDCPLIFMYPLALFTTRRVSVISGLDLVYTMHRCQGCRLCYRSSKFRSSILGWLLIVVRVQNYDFPNNCEDYIHRIGRTGVIVPHFSHSIFSDTMSC